MPTDLFVAASGWPSDALAAAVPPSCRREVERAPSPRLEGDAAVVEFPEWRPRRPASHLVPSFSASSPGEAGFRFELSVRTGARWSPWVAGASIGPAAFAPLATRADGIAVEIDEFTLTPPADAVRVRLRVGGADRHAPFDAPWLVALSAWDGEPRGSDAPRAGTWARLEVPPLSQMAEAEAIRMRICSPASVAMVLGYLGHPVEVAALAREIFHPGLERYGVWPAAIFAAGRRGVAGYLLRFPDWESAAWCLDHGLPVIVSVRYGAGELEGAAIPETTGHLLVLTGWEGGEVLVNDPAAPHAGEVARRYRLDELRRAWLARAGVGYVLFTPSTSPTGRSPRP
jgi:hypothetical protein